MKFFKLLIVLPLFTLFACNSNTSDEIQIEHIQSADSLKQGKEVIEEKDPNVKSDTDSILEKAKKFVRLMYDDQYAVYDFNENPELRSSHIKHYSDKGILDIYGLGHNRYKEDSNFSPLQLDVYLFKYENDSLAKLSRDNIINRPWNISPAKEGLHPNTPKDSLEKPVFLDPKPGGFIFQYKNFVISLIKKCGGNNLNNIPWPEYESRFLNEMNIKEKIEVIWAKCGHAEFEIKNYNQKHPANNTN
tara:strand:- start:84428 stop:85165 length:738 start_codon:yes stop_codon:yes gene_type:complete